MIINSGRSTWRQGRDGHQDQDRDGTDGNHGQDGYQCRDWDHGPEGHHGCHDHHGCNALNADTKMLTQTDTETFF